MQERIAIFITNLTRYHDILCGEWVKLPIPQEELDAVLSRIGSEGDEFFITDYEVLFGNLHISEYASIQELNELAEQLEGLADHEYEKLAAVLECESSMSIVEVLETIDALDNYDLLEDVDSDAGLAEFYIDNGYIFCDVPDSIKMYLDLDRLGRDIRLDGDICYTSFGTVVRYH